MKTNPNILYLYTSTYPYGENSEPYLVEELKILSNNFEQIVIFPFTKVSDTIRDVPSNTTVNNSIIEGKRDMVKFGDLKWKDKFNFIRIIFGEMIQNRKISIFIKQKRDFGYLYAEACNIAKILKNQISKDGQIIHYSYWFDYASLGLALAKKNKDISFVVARSHGFDLYDYRNSLRLHPYRNFKTKQMNSVFPVSETGVNYFKSKVSKRLRFKVNRAYLGVNNQNELIGPTENKEKVVVTCSSLIPLKRLSILCEAFMQVTIPVKWIHIGTGPEMERLRKECEKLPANIQVYWKGNMTNVDVFNFYQIHWVDLFVNCSYSEGLPVSMMEAISFGIPILSFDVGGIAEIVTPETGFLVADNQDEKGFSTTLNEVFKKPPLDRGKIRSHFENHFDALKNYTNFTENLKALFIKSKR